jgi:hypothetical protein
VGTGGTSCATGEKRAVNFFTARVSLKTNLIFEGVAAGFFVKEEIGERYGAAFVGDF